MTLTPEAGEPEPPELSFLVAREECEPLGWIPTLLDREEKLIPNDIDPEFARLHCTPAP